MRERPQNVDEWKVDRSQINRALEHVFEHYDVRFMYCDPGAGATSSRIGVTDGRTGSSSWRPTRTRCPSSSIASAPGSRRAGSRTTATRTYTGTPGQLIDACVAAVLAVEVAAQIPEGSDLQLAVFV